MDVSGGANFMAKADNGVIVHRDWARVARELAGRPDAAGVGMGGVGGAGMGGGGGGGGKRKKKEEGQEEAGGAAAAAQAQADEAAARWRQSCAETSAKAPPERGMRAGDVEEGEEGAASSCSCCPASAVPSEVCAGGKMMFG